MAVCCMPIDQCGCHIHYEYITIHICFMLSQKCIYIWQCSSVIRQYSHIWTCVIHMIFHVYIIFCIYISCIKGKCREGKCIADVYCYLWWCGGDASSYYYLLVSFCSCSFFTTSVSDDNLIEDRNWAFCRHCCIGCCYRIWLRFQNCLLMLVHDMLFDMTVTLCIVLNTAFLAIEHHGMSEDLKHVLEIGNKVCENRSLVCICIPLIYI